MMNWAVRFGIPPWIPTACPGSQPHMATGVFFRVCGLDSLADCVLGLGHVSQPWALISVRWPEAVHMGDKSAEARKDNGLLPSLCHQSNVLKQDG